MNPDLDRIQFEFGFASDRGRKRQRELNQDSIKVVLPGAQELWHPPLLLVADGLGGYYGGALASQLVVRTFEQEFKRAQHPSADYASLLRKCAQAAHQEIRAQGQKDSKLASMGSTVVAVTWAAQRLYLLNVGDSRAYLLREKNILQVSQDQSWVAEKVRAGIVTEQEARTHADRNRLTMAITAKRSRIESYTTEEPLEPQDIILLCSDGLWGVVPETLIRAAAVELPPQAAADKLIALANRNKGPDNISVVIARPTAFASQVKSMALEDTNS